MKVYESYNLSYEVKLKVTQLKLAQHVIQVITFITFCGIFQNCADSSFWVCSSWNASFFILPGQNIDVTASERWSLHFWTSLLASLCFSIECKTQIHHPIHGHVAETPKKLQKTKLRNPVEPKKLLRMRNLPFLGKHKETQELHLRISKPRCLWEWKKIKRFHVSLEFIWKENACPISSLPPELGNTNIIHPRFPFGFAWYVRNTCVLHQGS